MKNFFTYILVVGIPLNYIAEYMQIPLVEPVVILPRAIVALFPTTLDIVVIFLIHLLMMKIYKDKLWAANWNFKKVLLVVMFGAILVILGEKVALTLGLWNYASSTPIIPVIQVGFTPVLHLATFPLVILYFASRKLTMSR